MSQRLPGYTKAQEEALLELLATPRPSRGIYKIRGWKQDTHGNLFRIAGNDPATAFVAHLDTVDRINIKKQKALNITREGSISLAAPELHSCLGADDAAGIWLLDEMANADVTGLYILFQNEEIGGLGSESLARHQSKDAEKIEIRSEVELPGFKPGKNGPKGFYSRCFAIDRMIAFDRKGTGSVIRQQFGKTCCSTQFAKALANKLNEAEPEFNYLPDPTGTFCDSARFTSLIRECTNLSVGFWNEHTKNEKLDSAHLLRLRYACLNIDWDSLPTAREIPQPQIQSENLWVDEILAMRDELSEMTWNEILQWVREAPEEIVAEVIYNFI